MKKVVCYVFSVFCFVSPVLGASLEAREAARAELLHEVQAIDVGGGALPGALILMGEDAFPLATCRNYDGSTAFAAAGAFYGTGRAVYFAHPGYLDIRPFLQDTEQLLKNAVAWTAQKKEAKLAVLRNAKVLAAFKELGFSDATLLRELDTIHNFDLLIANEFRRDEVEPVLEFVKQGGGLIGAGLGWGFLFFNPTAYFAEDFVDNRIMGTMGILMGNIGTERIGGAFPTACDTIPVGTFVEDALKLVTKEEGVTAAQRKQMARTLTYLVNALPSGVRPEINAQLLQLAAHPAAALVPSPDTPVGSEAVFARLAIIARKNAWQAEPEKNWPADPAAAVYPGLVAPDTPAIDKQVAINLAIPRWHSTGFFAPAGRPLTITLEQEALALGLKVRVGSTADDLTSAEEWRRAPMVTVEIPLVKETTTFASPFGGLVYIVVPRGAPQKEIKVGLDGGVMAPWFKLGRDTNEDFIEQCANSGAPYGEIESHDFIVTAETASLQKVDDPHWIAEYWDKVLQANQDLAQWKVRTSPERICSDVQLISGWLHDGYPIMSHINEERYDWAVNKEQLMRGDAWGCYHEIGHNHQARDWTPVGTEEVTVNLFTCYAIETVTGANIRENRFPSGRQAALRSVKNWVAKGKKFEDWKGDYFLALEMYLRIKEAYGWDAYKQTFARYLEPGFQHPRNDAEKWQIFAKELSQVVAADMAAVLAAWSIPINDATKEFCARFPAAKASLTQNLVKQPYESPKTEPVTGLYMGITLAGKEAGTIAMFATREEIPAGEQDQRWKTTHLLLRRIEPTSEPFVLGNRAAATNAWDAPHAVEISQPYYIGVYEVTQEQYFYVMDQWRKNCFGAPGDREERPVNGISYNEIRGGLNEGINWPKTGYEVSNDSFMGRLRELVAFRAEFDLPTEAQWEYAARALTTGEWNNGEASEGYTEEDGTARDRNLDKLGRYFGNGGESRQKDDPLMHSGIKTSFGTAIVGSYQPNAWGIYDTHGNVYEWTLDYWMPICNTTAYQGRDPLGPLDSGVAKDGKSNPARRTMRGGSWWNFLFGSPGRCVSWDRNLGNLCDPGTGHGAVGLRVAVAAAVAREPQVGPGSEKLSPAAYAARKELLEDVGVYTTAGLPGPVYCTNEEAFPLLAARNWDGSAAACAGAAFYGQGRVLVLADDAIATDGDNTVLVQNAEKWLSQGGTAEIKKVDLATLEPGAIPELEAFVKAGGGLLTWGRAWPWRQIVAATTGNACVATWPGNQLLYKFGLLVGDFCVSQTADKGFSAARWCAEGCAIAPPEIFATQRYPRPRPPVVRPPKERNAQGIMLSEGETIAFLGDSITRLGAEPLGYINLVVKGLEIAGVAKVEVVPAGIDGQHAADMLGRIGGILSNPEVKVIAISCGVNDVWGFDWGRGLELEEYLHALRSMYDKAAAMGVQVIALTPTLIQEDPDDEKNRLLDLYAEAVRAEARARGLPLADCRAAQVAALADLPQTGEKYFTYDGVHPVWEGNKLIARAVLKALGVSGDDAAIEAAWQVMHEVAQ